MPYTLTIKQQSFEMYLRCLCFLLFFPISLQFVTHPRTLLVSSFLFYRCSRQTKFLAVGIPYMFFFLAEEFHLKKYFSVVFSQLVINSRSQLFLIILTSLLVAIILIYTAPSFLLLSSLILVSLCSVYYFVPGIMATGAVNVVRGSRSSVEELLQIYHHSERYAQTFNSFIR